MIHDLDRTIREILREEAPSVKSGQAEVSFQQPTREWATREGSKPTINLYLYDVRENAQLRTHQWETIVNGHNDGLPRPENTATQKRTPMRVDCFYMLTTWANDPGDEHRLLAEAMIVLFRHGILPEDMLHNGLKTNQPFDIRTQLARHDVLTNPAELWGALDNDIRPTVSYVVTLTLDPWTEITGPAVQTFTITTGQEQKPSELRKRSLHDTGKGAPLTYIGGVVYSKGKESQPLADVEVVIDGTGLYTRTDAEGKFRFFGLQPGDFKLFVRSGGKESKPKAITVPAQQGENYNLEF